MEDGKLLRRSGARLALERKGRVVLVRGRRVAVTRWPTGCAGGGERLTVCG